MYLYCNLRLIYFVFISNLFQMFMQSADTTRALSFIYFFSFRYILWIYYLKTSSSVGKIAAISFPEVYLKVLKK